MKKHYFLPIMLILVIPSVALASWWNPLSWNVFKNKPSTSPTIQENSKPVNSPFIIQNKQISSTTPPSKKIIESKKDTTNSYKPSAVTSFLGTSNDTISFQDKTAITSTIKGFLFNIRNKNSNQANSLISDQTKKYLDNILGLAKTANKMILLRSDILTITSVALVRITASTSTLDLDGANIIAKAISLGTSTPLNNLNEDSMTFSFEHLEGNTFRVTMNSGDLLETTLNVVKENGVWKIDFTPSLIAKKEELEKQVGIAMQKTGKTREEIVKSLLSLFFGRFDSELDYFTWIPLNERGDLKTENAVFNHEFDNGIAGYSIKIPDYWVADIVDSTFFFIAPYSYDGIKPTIAITPNFASYSTNLDTYVDDLIKQLPLDKPDVTGSIKKKWTTFKNQPAYEITYDRLRTFNEGRTYIKQANLSMVFIRNNTIYLVEYRNGIADFEKTRPLANKIIDTLEFKLPCSTNNCRSGDQN